MTRSGRDRLSGLMRRFGAQCWIDEHGIAIARYTPTLPHWPADLPLRIAMLSDFHFAEPWMGRQAVEYIVEKTNALQPDIILLLGDFEEGPRFSRPISAPEWAPLLAPLSAPLGVHAVLGNHDYPRLDRKRHRAVARPAALDALERVGFNAYVNQASRLSWQGKRFWLAGLGDQHAYWPDGRPLANLGFTLHQIRDEAPIILMAHEPDIFPGVPDRISLTLSGHVHRGQIRFFGYAPVVPSRYGRRYLHGHIVEGGRHLIVGAGLGHSGLPLRFHAAPEIVLVDLGGRNG